MDNDLFSRQMFREQTITKFSNTMLTNQHYDCARVNFLQKIKNEGY